MALGGTVGIRGCAQRWRDWIGPNARLVQLSWPGTFSSLPWVPETWCFAGRIEKYSLLSHQAWSRAALFFETALRFFRVFVLCRIFVCYEIQHFWLETRMTDNNKKAKHLTF